MGNLAAAARADRARDEGEYDTTMHSARKELGRSTFQADSKSLGRSAAPARRLSPTNPFHITSTDSARERYERPPSRPPFQTTSSVPTAVNNNGYHMPSSASSSSIATMERQLYLGSPAKWDANAENAPSPFLKRTTDVLGTQPPTTTGSTRPSMPRSRSTAGVTAGPSGGLSSLASVGSDTRPSLGGGGGGSNLARMAMGNAMRTEARPAVTGRSSRLGGFERRESLARAEQAYEEAGRVMQMGH